MSNHSDAFERIAAQSRPTHITPTPERRRLVRDNLGRPSLFCDDVSEALCHADLLSSEPWADQAATLSTYENGDLVGIQHLTRGAH